MAELGFNFIIRGSTMIVRATIESRDGKVLRVLDKLTLPTGFEQMMNDLDDLDVIHCAAEELVGWLDAHFTSRGIDRARELAQIGLEEAERAAGNLHLVMPAPPQDGDEPDWTPVFEASCQTRMAASTWHSCGSCQ